jgi:hypothetical protein
MSRRKYVMQIMGLILVVVVLGLCLLSVSSGFLVPLSVSGNRILMIALACGIILLHLD